MPIRSRALGIFDEHDLAMLEEVLAKVSPPSDTAEVRDFYAARLIQLFEGGVRDADELQARLQNSAK